MTDNTSSEAWRKACEIRHVLSLMDKGRGNAARYLALVEQRRGKEAADDLKRAAAEEWRKANG